MRAKPILKGGVKTLQRESSLESSLIQHGISCTNLPFLNSQATVNSCCNLFLFMTAPEEDITAVSGGIALTISCSGKRNREKYLVPCSGNVTYMSIIPSIHHHSLIHPSNNVSICSSSHQFIYPLPIYSSSTYLFTLTSVCLSIQPSIKPSIPFNYENPFHLNCMFVLNEAPHLFTR